MHKLLHSARLKVILSQRQIPASNQWCADNVDHSDSAGLVNLARAWIHSASEVRASQERRAAQHSLVATAQQQQRERHRAWQEQQGSTGLGPDRSFPWRTCNFISIATTNDRTTRRSRARPVVGRILVVNRHARVGLCYDGACAAHSWIFSLSSL
jgi:hypothetical protein